MSERFGTVLCDPTKQTEPEPVIQKIQFMSTSVQDWIFFSYLGLLWVIFQGILLYYVSKVRLQIF